LAWISEHHLAVEGDTPSTLIPAAALATRTERMSIGTSALILPLQHPVRLAENALTVWAFDEGQAISVVGLPLDVQPADAVTNWSPGDPATPTTLTRDVSVHYLHLDTGAGNIVRDGFVEFDAPILGVILETSSLDKSDVAVGSGSLVFDSNRLLGSTNRLRIESR